MRVIESGIAADDRVIVNGLQRVRPGVVVDPKMAEMPTGGSESNLAETPSKSATPPAANTTSPTPAESAAPITPTASAAAPTSTK
jgi:hypothetical protein